MLFFGEVGFGETVETPPDSGIHELVMTRRNYYGDVLRDTRQSQEGQYLNNDLSVSNVIRIVADAFANERPFAIKYVVWRGIRWVVSDVSVEPPRLVLRLGEVYNGPTAE